MMQVKRGERKLVYNMRLMIFVFLKCTGVGKLKPNTLILGFKNNWSIEKVDSVLEYYEMIK